MDFNDLIDNKSEIPENFGEVFISNLKDIMEETNKGDEEFLSFIDGFMTECGQKILEYNLKVFTKEEIWKNILLCKTPEYKKLISFSIEYNKFLMNLFQKYSDEQDKKEFKREREIYNKKEKMNDEWTT